MKRPIPVLLGSMLLGSTLLDAALGYSAPAAAQTATSVASIDPSQLALPATAAARRIDSALAHVSGPIDIVVQLSDPPLVVANGENSRRLGGLLNRGQQIAHSERLRQRQDEVLAKIIALGGTEIGRVRIAYNAAIVRVDAARLPQIVALPGVIAVHGIADYRLDLSQTVPYIGASAAQAVGLDGFGVKVALLDSGVDYTHRNLGGPGTVGAYRHAYGTSAADPRNKTLNGDFPTDKVIGGFDFVGEAWTGAADSPPLAPDPNPIDANGHGTHVADIIAGKSTDGKHVGVAPGASLLAVKVCSAVTTSCSGVAILEGIDFALDPDGDGDMDDAVDVINMSLGAPYGQREDSTSAAAANAARAGVVVVAAAGNDGDKPYILGSPSSAPEVISVAQTQVPSAEAIPLVINSPSPIAGKYGNTATIEWAPIDTGATGNIAYVGRGCAVANAGASPPVPAGGDRYLTNPAGRIALIDRGDCNVSEKVRRASDAGAVAILIGLVAPGDAVTFANGGQCPQPPDGTCEPSLVIQQSLSSSIKTQLAMGAAVKATISASNRVSLVGSMVSTSSRGPSYDFNQIKPDIGAPGASVSAVVGTGTGEAPFGGTSGATPMVAGSAAILLQAYPSRSPSQIKSVLMNTADTEIFTNPATLPGVVAPVTRIGGGEVRVDRALASTTAAWDTQQHAGSLSFGYHAVSDLLTLRRRVHVQNYSRENRVYSVASSFRYATEATGAVTLQVPPRISVPAHGSETFDVIMKIDPSRLPTWTLNGGPQGGNGPLLQTVEFDGYLNISDERDHIHLAWQVLPHKAADIHAVNRQVTIAGDAVGRLALRNVGEALPGRFDVFSLTGTSPRIPAKDLPADGANFAVIDLAAVGVRLVQDDAGNLLLQFAVNTFGARAHPLYPAEFDVEIDTNLDGKPDFIVFNAENGGPITTGQDIIAVVDVATGVVTPVFFADADLDSANMIMTVPLAAVGLTPNAKFSFNVLAVDNYFTGNVTDQINGMVYTAGVPKFVTSVPPDSIAPDRAAMIAVDDFPGGDKASPSQTGLLLMYRDAHPGLEAEAITVKAIPKRPKK